MSLLLLLFRVCKQTYSWKTRSELVISQSVRRQYSNYYVFRFFARLTSFSSFFSFLWHIIKYQIFSKNRFSNEGHQSSFCSNVFLVLLHYTIVKLSTLLTINVLLLVTLITILEKSSNLREEKLEKRITERNFRSNFSVSQFFFVF